MILNSNYQLDKNKQLFYLSNKFIPGGVNSPVRAYQAVGMTPRFIKKAAGAYVVDENNKKYVDLVSAWGPALLGHAPKKVIAAVCNTAKSGLSFGSPTRGEYELAQILRERVNLNGINPIEKIRLVSSGTESTMTAVRLARGITKRDLIIKFEGHYHGHSDGLISSAGSGVATLNLTEADGIPASISQTTLVLPYNDITKIQAAFEAYPNRIAAVIVEAAAANMGVIAPQAGFNSALVKIAHKNGALVIFDEVLTGFRVSSAGWWGYENRKAKQIYLPDLFTFGKVIGGGLPLAAVGGKAEFMDCLAPVGKVYQAGTLSGNPLAVQAGIATLNNLTTKVYKQVNKTAKIVAKGISAALRYEGVAHQLLMAGNLFSFAFGEQFLKNPPINFKQIKTQNQKQYRIFFQNFVAAGILPPPSPFEAWFISYAHKDKEVEKILTAATKAAKAVAKSNN